MLIGAVAIAAALLSAGGGPLIMYRSLREQDPDLVTFTNFGALSSTLAYSLSVGVKFLVEPRQLSRFYGLRDGSALRIASIGAPLAIFVTYLCLLPVGAMARTVVKMRK